jgi:hypothetical protein
MHAAERASLVVERRVDLSDARLEAVRRVLALAKRSSEKATRVLAQLELDFERACELRLGELQAAALPR